MPKIEIYTKPTCPFCRRAIELLESKHASFELINIAAFPDRRDEMIERANGRTTVPEIFIDGQLIGGCDDLFELDAKGELDKRLNQN